MSYIPSIYGAIDTNNSSTTPLGSNGVFTGTGVDVTNYASISVYVTTDQSSTTNGLQLQFSTDDTNWDLILDRPITITIPGTSNAFNFTSQVRGQYFRVVYNNSTTAQTTFRLQTIYNAQTINSVDLISSVIGNVGRHKPIICSPDGSLNVCINDPVSSFGDLRTVSPTPITQFDFVYGLNTNYVLSTTATGGTITNVNQSAEMITTTTSGSSAIVQSKKYFKYRDGMGGLVRFTALFSTGQTNNNQIAGAGDTTDGYFFGFNGTTFGILYRRNASDTWIPQTTWNYDQLDGANDSLNPSNMKLDPTKGNVYQITIAYLGYANINFFIYNPMTCGFVKVHSLRYANSNTVPLVTNPSMNIWWQNLNTGTTASTTTLTGTSGGIFTDGMVLNLGAKYGRSATKLNPGTTEISMITLRNNSTINSITNKAPVRLSKITFGACDTTASNNANTVILNMYLNTTVGGTPAFTNIDAVSSLTAFDIAGTTVTGGVLIQSYSCVYGSVQTIDIDSYDVILFPSDRLTHTITCSGSSASTRAVVSINWIEDS